MNRFNQLTVLLAILFTVSANAAEKIYFVHNDHLGSPETLTDETQAVVWQASKDPFWNSAPAVEQVGFDFRFPGQYFDAESGLYYNWNRYYDAKSGRYVTSDPIGLDGGLNTYGYAYQNPLYWIDPEGLQNVRNIRPGYEDRPAPGSGDPCKCFEKVLGVDTAIGAGLVAGGQPTIGKRFAGKGRSRGTSPISSGLSKALPQKMPVSLPAPTTKNPTSRTNILGRFLGRWAPIVGWGMLGYDFLNLKKCLEECDEGQCSAE